MARLGRYGQPAEEPKHGSRLRLVSLSVLALFGMLLLAFFVGAGSVVVYMLATTTTTTTSTTTSTTTTSTTSTTTSTASTTSTSTSTTSTTTTSTSTTTTTLCGGEDMLPCQANNSCNAGFVANSYGYCISPECGRTVTSGNAGCGSWNVGLYQNDPKWCKPGGVNPANKGLFHLPSA